MFEFVDMHKLKKYLVLVYPVSLRCDLFDNIFIKTISEFPEPELNFFPRPVVYKRKYKLFSSKLLWPILL